MTARRTLYSPSSPRSQLLGESGYVVTIVAKDEEVFNAAARNPAFRMLTGVALAEKMLAFLPPGDIREVTYEKGGNLEDGPEGEPARRRFDAGSGAPVLIEHYRGGKLNDDAQGVPASQEKRKGNRWWISRYRDGKLQDGPNGEPAQVLERGSYYAKYNDVGGWVRPFTEGDAGETLVLHYRADLQVQGPEGAPGVRLYKNGALTRAWRVSVGKRGDRDEGLSRKELKALPARLQTLSPPAVNP